jgi:hypothetical protein
MSDEPELARLLRRVRSLGRSGGGPWPRPGRRSERRPWDEKPDLPGRSWDEQPDLPGRSWDEAPPP